MLKGSTEENPFAEVEAMTRSELLMQASIEHARDIQALAKTKIGWMSVIVALGSAGIAATKGYVVDAFHLVAILAGVFMLVSGAAAGNMAAEPELDGQMSRTQKRPIPAGRLEVGEAWLWSALWTVAGLLMLALSANLLSMFLGVVAYILYVAVYTPMKRWTAFAVVVGAIPGAIPAWLGYTALSNTIDTTGFLLFFVMFLWQIPHTWAICIYRRDEYRAAGFKLAPEKRFEGTMIFGIVLTTMMTSVMAVQLAVTVEAHGVWLGGVLILSTLFAFSSVRGFFAKVPALWARKYFFGTLIFACVLYSGFVANYMLLS